MVTPLLRVSGAEPHRHAQKQILASSLPERRAQMMAEPAGLRSGEPMPVSVPQHTSCGQPLARRRPGDAARPAEVLADPRAMPRRAT